jgi:hypothetical protein
MRTILLYVFNFIIYTYLWRETIVGWRNHTLDIGCTAMNIATRPIRMQLNPFLELLLAGGEGRNLWTLPQGNALNCPVCIRCWDCRKTFSYLSWSLCVRTALSTVGRLSLLQLWNHDLLQIHLLIQQNSQQPLLHPLMDRYSTSRPICHTRTPGIHKFLSNECNILIYRLCKVEIFP